MLPQRRRHAYMIGLERRKSRWISRLIIGIIVLLIAWYLASKVYSLFDQSIVRRAAAVLSVRSGVADAQVSLQGGDWQRAQSSLKLYPGDAVSARGSADMVVTFFDGTRMRLEQGGEMSIGHSEAYGGKGVSVIEVTMKAGRAWISSPTVDTFSGAITRTIVTSNFSADVPASTNALISASRMAVLKASGIGILTTLTIPKAKGKTLYIGEGQFLTLNDETIRKIQQGDDPYNFRDPLTPEVLKDDFLISSNSLFSSQPTPTNVSGSAAVIPGTGEVQDLVISSPENRATVTTKTVTVSGRVSLRTALVLVNGQSVSIRKDQTFSVDQSIGKDQTTQIHIEAQDAQGVTLADADRTVMNAYRPVVEAPKIKSPGGSGETVTVSATEIEITGEAAPQTAAIVVNDYRLQLFKPGEKTWSYLASTALGNLVPGPNTFTVYALDTDGNKSQPRSVTVILTAAAAPAGTGTALTQPPLKQNPPLAPGVLIVTAPESGTSTTVSEKEIVLAGNTSAETYSISINGYTLSLYLPGKTTWNYIASTDLQTMKRGRNIYRIVARNKDGEILDVLEYTINYKP